MIVVLVSTFWLVGIFFARKTLFNRHHTKVKLILFLCYIAFIAEVVDRYNTAMYADEHQLDGAVTGWFGPWWLIVLLLLALLISALHTWLYAASKRNASS